MFARLMVTVAVLFFTSVAYAGDSHAPGDVEYCAAQGHEYASKECPAGDAAGRKGAVLDLTKATSGPLYIVTGQIVKIGHFKSYGQNATWAPGAGQWFEHDEAKQEGSAWVGVFYVGADCANYFREKDPFKIRYVVDGAVTERAVVKVPPASCSEES